MIHHVKKHMPIVLLITASLAGGFGALKIIEHFRKPKMLPGSGSTIPPQHIWGRVAQAARAKVLALIGTSSDPAQLRVLAEGLNSQGAVGAAAAAHVKANKLENRSSGFIDKLHGATPKAVNVPTVSPAQATSGAGHPVIRKGSHGDDVRLWQSFLGLKADGDFGPNTELATRAFQRKHNLGSDGVVGKNTWGAAGL